MENRWRVIGFVRVMVVDLGIWYERVAINDVFTAEDEAGAVEAAEGLATEKARATCGQHAALDYVEWAIPPMVTRYGEDIAMRELGEDGFLPLLICPRRDL